MASRYSAALARADAAQLRIHGEDCTFHDPHGSIEDASLAVVFSERDIAERPNNVSAPKGQYSHGWTLLSALSALSVANPEGFQIVVDGYTYSIYQATADGGGGVTMKLHKARATSPAKLIDSVTHIDNVTDMDTLAES